MRELPESKPRARQRAESLQSAPVAVSAFTARAIQEQGLVSINDIAQFTPGLSFSQAFGRTTDRPVIRGQSGERVQVTEDGADSLDVVDHLLARGSDLGLSRLVRETHHGVGIGDGQSRDRQSSRSSPGNLRARG